MKKLILAIAWLLMSVFAFAQTASISGPNHLCEGEYNQWMYAQITGGIQTTDTLIWLQSINSEPTVVISDTTGNWPSVIIPRDPVTLNLIPAVVGNIYSYTLIIKRGTNTYYSMISVSVIPMPAITLTANPASLCPGQSTTLHVTGGTDYTWDNGLSPGDTHILIPDSNTTYTVWGWDLTHTCWGITSAYVLINSPPIVAITGNAPICGGGLLHLVATYDPTFTYSWSGPNGPITTNPLYPNNVILTSTTAADLGIYTVTVFDGNCSSSANFHVANFPAPIVNITSAGGANTVCPGGDLQLYANSSTSPAQYDWSTGESAMSIIAHPLTSPTVYTIIVSDLITGCSTVDSFTVYIQPLPIAFNITGNTTYCPSQFGVNIGLDSSQVGVTYKLWHSGIQIGTALGTGHAISFGMVSNANGAYTATGETNLGCLSSMTGTLNVTPSSVPNAAGPITGFTALCTGSGNPTYSVAPITGATSYVWTITNGYITSSPIDSNVVTIHWTNSGTVTVSGQNSCGNGNASPTLNVQLNPIPIVSIWPLSPHICPGDTVVLNGTGASTLNWSGPNGLHTGSNYSATAGGILSLIGISSFGCMSQSISISITLDSIPIITGVGPTNTICTGSLLQLTAIAHPISTYQWSGPSGFTASVQNPSITNALTSNAGTYSVVATTGHGCKATAYLNVVINPTPSITCSGTASTCDGNTVYLNATGPNIQWVAKDSTYLMVSPSPSVTITASDNSICSGESVILTANSSGSNSYHWSNGTTGTTTVVAPQVPTTYAVTATNVVSGCSATSTIQIAINGNSLTSLFTSFGMVTCPGGSNGWANLGMLNGYSPYIYSWTPNPQNGQGSSAVSGLYANVWQVNITDSHGCHGTNNVTITEPNPITIGYVVNGQTLSLNITGGTMLPGDLWQVSYNPTPITQSYLSATFANDIHSVIVTAIDGALCQQSLVIPLNSVGIEEVTNATISIYPNPVSDLLHLETGDIKITKTEIYDVTGKLVFTSTGKEKVLHLKAFVPGMYMLTLTTDEGQTYHSKIIKQ